ncbi:LPXTG cell wall anchor domain-containing protein [Halobacillus salinarum]|uniref:LPXTG cell wall anchor domain-containing protein n=1 Tax=Halobacillus salinarum TaxID=2932257 RepID=A0ABY4EP45_9BACI|nr:LPXTG cell wall anchor domain-containing protein [Halobacillus salinarum]UOQ45928.1 LPXTG cell wall anchor domain-containing protein [Halobacillus salinarum]
MVRKLLFAGVMFFGILAGGNQAVHADSDKNCDDFSNHDAVMEFWYDNGYDENNDPHGLDGDNDGLPCEVSSDAWNSFVADKEDSNSDDGTTSDEDSSAADTNESMDEGGELPDTATNNPLMMIIGLGVIAVGGSFFIRRKQAQ